MKKILIPIILSVLVAVSSCGPKRYLTTSRAPGVGLDTINYGAYNNDPSADKARPAFMKANGPIREYNRLQLYNLEPTELAILRGAVVTTAELNRISGVTSAVQTQINGRIRTVDSTGNAAGNYVTRKALRDTVAVRDAEIALKANSASPTFTGTVTLPATTSIGTVTDTEIGYLAGASSNIQDQLDNTTDLETILRFNYDTDTLATRAYARSVGGSGGGSNRLKLQFRIDTTAGAPKTGDSIFTNDAFKYKYLDVFRAGHKQYENPAGTPNITPGFRYTASTGQIIFRPTFTTNEQVVIEAYDTASVDYLTLMTLTEDLVSYWKMDEVSGNLVDEKGNKNLSVYDAPTPQQTGKINYCWSYDGTDDYHGTTDTLVLNHRDAFTAAAWVKTATTSSDGCVLGAMDGAGSGWGWYVTLYGASSLRFRMYDGTTSYILTAAADVSDQTWHHVVASYDGTNMRLYVDGSEVGTSIEGDVAYAQYAFFRINRINGEYLDAYIDNVAYWHRCLSPSEISALYDLENAGTEYPWN